VVVSGMVSRQRLISFGGSIVGIVPIATVLITKVTG